MSSKSLIELSKCRLREYCREPSALLFVILMPLIWMLILGYSFSEKKLEQHPVGFLTTNLTNIEETEAVIQKTLTSSPEVKLQISEDKSELDILLKQAKISLWIEVKDNHISYIFDPNNDKALKGKHRLNQIIQTAFGRKDPIASKEVYISMPGSRYIDFLVPGLLALSLFTTSLYGTGMTLVANRREKLLKRYKSTPMRSSDFFLSHIIGRFVISLLELASIMLAAYMIFDFKILGSLFDYTVMCFFGVLSFTSLAILCGSRLANAGAYNGFVNLIVLPAMFLSGIWYSRNYYPDWLSGLSDFIPLTALVNALRKIALEGIGISSLIPEIAILICSAVIFTLLSKKLFKWY